jgi:hypothetical protein
MISEHSNHSVINHSNFTPVIQLQQVLVMVVVVVITINAVKKDNIKKKMMENLFMLNIVIHLGLKGAYCKTGMRRQRTCLNRLPPRCK